MGSSFKLDDLLGDKTQQPTETKPPQKKKPDEGVALGDLLGSDSTPAAPVVPATTPAPRNGAVGDVDLRTPTDTGAAPVVAPSPAPAPRRGIGARIADWLGENVGTGLAASAQGQAPIANIPVERRTPVEIEDRRTRDEKLTAAKARVTAGIGAPSDASAVRPMGSPMQEHEDEVNRRANVEARRQASRFTPEGWREIARQGAELANRLHAEGKHDEAEDANRKAYNAQLLADGAQNADTFEAIALSSLLGIIRDPYAQERANLNKIANESLTFTPEEQRTDLGSGDPLALRRGFDPNKDLTAPLVGSLPLYIVGGALGRDALTATSEALAGAEAGTARSALSRRLARLASEAEVTGVPEGELLSGRAGLRQAVDNYRQNIGTLITRGATEGQIIGAAQAVREAQQTGEDPATAAAGALLLGAPMGIAGELAFGAVGRALPLLDRTITSGIRRTLDDLGKIGYLPEESDFARAVEMGREAQGQTPLADQTVTGQHATIAKALAAVLDQKKEAPTFGSESGLILRDPTALDARPAPVEVNPPLRSARDIGLERAGYVEPRPSEEANALVQMERTRRAAEAEQQALADEAERVRIEQAAAQRARERQGPLTLAQTLARAGRDAAQGDPLAAEYHAAINTYVDALTAAKGENAPERAKVALARARAALNDARRKYGVQIGAAALVSMANADSDLTDDEKRAVNMGALAIGSMHVVRAIPRPLAKQALESLDRLRRQYPTEEALASPRQNWMEHFAAQGVEFGAHHADIDRELHAAAMALGGPDANIPAQAVRDIFERHADEASARFVSRLENHVKALPKKWDQPTSAQTWLDYLGKKGQPYNVREYAIAIEPTLKAAKESGEKLTKQQVLDAIQQYRPRVDELRYTEGGRPSPELKIEEHPGPWVNTIDNAGRRRDMPDRHIVEEYGDGPAVREVAERYEAEVDEARDRLNDLETQMAAAMHEVEGRATDLGVRAAALHRIMDDVREEADYGFYYDPDKLIDELRDSGNLDEPYPDLPDGVTVRRAAPSEGDPYGVKKWEVEDAGGETIATGRTRLEAMVNAERDGHVSLGGEYRLFSGSESVRPVFDTLDEGYVPEAWLIEGTGNRELDGMLYHSRETAERIVAADAPEATPTFTHLTNENPGNNAAWGVWSEYSKEFMFGERGEYNDIDELLNDYIADHWQGTDNTDALRQAIERLNERSAEYYEYESETYALREDPIRYLDDWHEQFTEAQASDEVTRMEQAGHDDYVNRGNPEYWALDQANRDFIDRSMAQGAVGTQQPIVDPYDGSEVLVFDPEQPHVPFPTRGELRPVNDPRQLQFEGFGEGVGREVNEATAAALPVVGVRELRKPRTLPELATDGSSKWVHVQEVPGGVRQRELILYYGNNPGEAYTGANAASHLHYPEVANYLGHLRVRDRLLYVGDEITPEIQMSMDKRAKLLERMNEIVKEHNELPPSKRTNPADPDVQRLQKAYIKSNEELLRIGRNEEQMRAALPSRKGQVPEVVTAATERQSDYLQDAVRDVLGSGYEAVESDMERIAKARAAGIQLPPEQELIPRGFKRVTEEGAAQAAALTEQIKPLNDEYLRLLSRSTELTEQEIKSEDAIADALYRTGYLGGRNDASMHPERIEAFIAAGPQGEITPEKVQAFDQLREAWANRWEGSEAQREYNAVQGRKAALSAQIAELASQREQVKHVNPMRPPEHAFSDPDVIENLLAGRLILEAVESDADRIGWSHSSNRMTHSSGYSMEAAQLNYDKRFLSAVVRHFKNLGFKNVEPEVVTMSGHQWWTLKVSPEMKAAVKKHGVTGLTVLAMLAAPNDAEAQDGSESSARIYGTLLGGIAAGALIHRMATRKVLRRLVKENRSLNRALLLDDLSGLSNQRAFLLARESIDRDPNTAWITFDANRFKAYNDTHGHPEGDKVIQHFGRVIREQVEKLDVPPRLFRSGGDEFSIAVPKERAAEVLRAIEDASPTRKGGVEASLTGAIGDTHGEADALLKDTKQANAKRDPTLARGWMPGKPEVERPEINAALTEEVNKALANYTPEDRQRIATQMRLYSNPIGPALSELKRYPSAAAIGVLGYAMTGSDNENIRRAGVPTMALAALSAIGSARLMAGGDYLGTKLVNALRQSEEGTKLVRAFNPDALLDPEVRDAILQFERDHAKGVARAAEFSKQAKRLGPEGDRAVSDILDDEAWEDTAQMSAEQQTDILTVAASLKDEYDRLTQEQLAAGTLRPSEVLPNYGGPRRYAYFDAQAALAEHPSAAQRGPGREARITSTRTRTLDIPLREAEEKLKQAQAGGDPAAIQAARDALDQAKVVQMSQRIERGEIREASYRAAQGIEKAHNNVASAKLFETIRNVPGSAHPEWVAAVDDLMAAKDMYRTATNDADREAADLLQHEAGARLAKITATYRRSGGDYVSLPDTPGLGALRGAVVKRDIAHSLEGFGQPGTYGKALRAWKELKTVFNIGTSVGNILSNVASLHVGEVPLWLQPHYLTQAVRDLANYGEGTRALAEAGILNVNETTVRGEGEVGRGMRSREGLEELLGTTRPETGRVLRQQGITEASIANRAYKNRLKRMAAGAVVGGLKAYDPDDPEATATGALVGAGIGAVFTGKTANWMRRLYGNEDNVARLAVFLRRRKLGDTIEQATEAATNSLGNFRTRSPALRAVSATVSPFILYTAKAVPAFARSVVDHPWKYLTLMAAWGAMNELSKEEVGEVPERDIPVADRRSYGYFFPGFTQLPFASERGEKAAIDLARWTPLSGLTTGAPPGSAAEAFSDDGSALVTPGGPVIDAALRASNVDPFTRDPLLKRDRPTSENVARAGREVANFMLPSSLAFHYERLKADIQNEDWTKFKNDLLGPTGAKPRYVRPGAVAVDAVYTLRRSLADMKQQFRKDLRANKNPDRVRELARQYQTRVATALANFKQRLGEAPPADLVHDYMEPEP